MQKLLSTGINRFESLPLLQSLPRETQHAISDSVKSRHYAPGQPIIWQNDQDNSVYFLVSGRVRVSLISHTGRELTLEEIDAPDCFGELTAFAEAPQSASARSASVTAVNATEAYVLEGALFRQLIEKHPAIALQMCQRLSARLRNLTQMTLQISTQDVQTRLRHYLAKQASGVGQLYDGGLLTQVPTHSEIATRIGSKREMVSRFISQLNKEGIIHTRRRTLQILSAKQLTSGVFEQPLY